MITKLYVPLVTLPINDNIIFLENINDAFKRTISWNKCKSEITTQDKTKNNNLDYLIYPPFRNINRSFVLSFENGNDDATRNAFDEKSVLHAISRNFNALIDNKLFFDQLVKKKQELHEKLLKMSRKDDYATGSLLDYLCHQKYYKLICIDLSRQTNTSIPKQFNFVGKLEENDGATMLFNTEKHQTTIANFSLDLLIVTD